MSGKISIISFFLLFSFLLWETLSWSQKPKVRCSPCSSSSSTSSSPLSNGRKKKRMVEKVVYGGVEEELKLYFSTNEVCIFSSEDCEPPPPPPGDSQPSDSFSFSFSFSCSSNSGNCHRFGPLPQEEEEEEEEELFSGKEEEEGVDRVDLFPLSGAVKILIYSPNFETTVSCQCSSNSLRREYEKNVEVVEDRGFLCNNKSVPSEATYSNNSLFLLFYIFFVVFLVGVLLWVIFVLLPCMFCCQKCCVGCTSLGERGEEREEEEEVEVLEWRNVTYRVTLKGNSTMMVLNKMSGVLRRGEMLGILGVSGAGKSSLLDILAGRDKVGSVNGEMLLNNKPVQPEYKSLVGYVNQDEDLLNSMTVRECFEFSADLRLPFKSLTKEEKRNKIDDLLKALDIYEIQDRLIGSVFRRSISGGEKKRVILGMELIARKPIMIFDEPSSGIDSYHAEKVMKTIYDICKKDQKIVIFSIHQPSEEIFKMFDKVLLIHNGQHVFFGTRGELTSWLENNRYQIPKGFSVPDYLIDLVRAKFVEIMENKTPETARVRKQDTNTELVVSEEENDENDEKIPLVRRLLAVEEEAIPTIPNNFYKEIQQVPMLVQFQNLSKRCFKSFYRDIFLLPAHLVFAIALGVFIGAVYFYLPPDLFGALSSVGAVFYVCLVIGLSTISSLETFVKEKSVYIRERSNGYYSPMMYYLAKIVFDIIPLRIIPPIIMSTIIYWCIGFRLDFVNYCWFVLIYTLLNICCGAVSLILATVCSSVGLANMILICILLYYCLFGGILVNKKNLTGLLALNKYFSPFSFVQESLVLNEYNNKWFCLDPATFPESAYAWINGNYILDLLDFEMNNFVFNVLLLTLTAFVYVFIGGVLIKYFVKEKK